MAVTSFVYGNMILQAFGSGTAGGVPNIDWLSDTIKVMLTTSAYVPDRDTQDFKNDVTNEITGTGYTATGVTLANPTLTIDTATNTVKWDADDAAWTGATFTARYAVIYDATPATDATRPLIAYTDFGADQSVSSGTFTITWAAGGIMTTTYA